MSLSELILGLRKNTTKAAFSKVQNIAEAKKVSKLINWVCPCPD